MYVSLEKLKLRISPIAFKHLVKVQQWGQWRAAVAMGGQNGLGSQLSMSQAVTVTSVYIVLVSFLLL